MLAHVSAFEFYASVIVRLQSAPILPLGNAAQANVEHQLLTKAAVRHVACERRECPTSRHLGRLRASRYSIPNETVLAVSLALRFWESRAGRFHDYKICLFRR